MHDIPQSTHGPWHNGDLLHRLGVFLQSADQRMPHLVIRDDLAFFRTHDTVLLFFPYQNLFHCIKQILLGDIFSAMLNRIDGSLIDHIGKICAYRPTGSKRYGIQIHALIQMNILRMYF